MPEDAGTYNGNDTIVREIRALRQASIATTIVGLEAILSDMRRTPDKRMTNPYESPLAEGRPTSKPEDGSIRCAWLATASLILAIMLEVLPTEADVVAVEARRGRLGIAILAKVIFLGIVLAPLVIYFVLNSWSAWKAAKGKILAVAVIVVLKMAMDLMFFGPVVTRGFP